MRSEGIRSLIKLSLKGRLVGDGKRALINGEAGADAARFPTDLPEKEMLPTSVMRHKYLSHGSW